MEHELFQSKLKSSVDGALVSSIIRSSSSGLNPHRTAAMELILERSIQERRERMFAKAKNSVRPDPTVQPKRASGAPNIPIQKVRPPAPAPVPQPPSQFLIDDFLSFMTRLPNLEASQGSSEDFVELACRRCNVKQLRRGLRSQSRIYCGLCSSGLKKGTEMKCVGCGTVGAGNVDACTGCHGKFK